MSLENPTKIPLSDARYFVFKLKEKHYFVKAIQEFNKKIQKNWLEEKTFTFWEDICIVSTTH